LVKFQVGHGTAFEFKGDALLLTSVTE